MKLRKVLLNAFLEDITSEEVRKIFANMKNVEDFFRFQKLFCIYYISALLSTDERGKKFLETEIIASEQKT